MCHLEHTVHKVRLHIMYDSILQRVCIMHIYVRAVCIITRVNAELQQQRGRKSRGCGGGGGLLRVSADGIGTGSILYYIFREVGVYAVL